MNLEDAWNLLREDDGSTRSESYRAIVAYLSQGEGPAEVRDFLRLYAPVRRRESGARAGTRGETRAGIRIIGHLGQSLDGHIATASGDSIYVTGPENITHLHRMRALCDAVVVGSRTVELDDPRLTTRRVSGTNPTRVVIDPDRRLGVKHFVFEDTSAPTLLVCDAGRGGGNGRSGETHAHAEVLHVPRLGTRLDLRALCRALVARDLNTVFVEGGGITVSAFLHAGLLHRLHIAIAPLLIGSGRPGIRLPEIATLADGIRPRHDVYAMGSDILYDCELQAPLHDGFPAGDPLESTIRSLHAPGGR